MGIVSKDKKIFGTISRELQNFGEPVHVLVVSASLRIRFSCIFCLGFCTFVSSLFTYCLGLYDTVWKHEH